MNPVYVTIAISVITILFAVIGFLLVKDNKALTARVSKNETDLESLKDKLEDKICSSNAELQIKMDSSNKEVLDAIKNLSAHSVHVNDCESNKKLLDQQYNAWIKMQEYKSEMDAKAHADILKTVQGFADHLEILTKCINDMQKGKECES